MTHFLNTVPLQYDSCKSCIFYILKIKYCKKIPRNWMISFVSQEEIHITHCSKPNISIYY